MTDNQINNPTTPYATKDDLKRIDYLMTGVVIVLFIGLIGAFFTSFAILLDAWQFKSSTFQNLTNQVIIQNNKIDTLEKEIQNMTSKK